MDFLFAEEDYDKEEVLTYLYYMDVSDYVLDEVNRLMGAGLPNTGFTYTNAASREALVVTGPVTSCKEFLNTLTHELRHLADAIAKSLNVKLDSEDAAYMTGDTAMALAETICELGCNCSVDK